MELSEWPEAELVALARIYIRRNRLQKAVRIRAELERRLAESEQAHLRIVYDQLDQKNVVTFASRLVSFFRHAS